MAFDPLGIAQVEERPDLPGLTSYAAAASDIYPAVIARIREALETGEIPLELVDQNPPTGVSREQGALLYLSAARRVPEAAWSDALMPRSHFAEAETERIAARAEALEVARRWFTRSLHLAFGGGRINLHITTAGDEDRAFRL